MPDEAGQMRAMGITLVPLPNLITAFSSPESNVGSTFFSLRAHVVFSAKERKNLIDAKWRADLHKYMGGTVRGLQVIPEAIGGIGDHVHLLVSYRPTLTISDFVRELKKASSIWCSSKHDTQFGWQDGYSVFSVSLSQKLRVAKYIANQEERHRKISFREELERLLHRHGIEFDPEYLE